MPRYRFHLANGKSLVLEGDEMPTDADVHAAADQAGVRSLLIRANDEETPSGSSSAPLAAGLGAAGLGAMAAAPAVISGVNAGARAMLGPYGSTIAGGMAAANAFRKGDVVEAGKEGLLTAAGAQATKPIVNAAARAVAMQSGPASMLARGAAALRGASGPMTAAAIPIGVAAYDAGLSPEERAAMLDQQRTAAPSESVARQLMMQSARKNTAKPSSTEDIAREIIAALTGRQ